MKKLLIILAILSGSAILYSMCGDDNTKELRKETVLSGKDAVMAKKFTHFIYKFAKKHNELTFQKRFRSIPPEDIKSVRETVLGIDKMGEPLKVTIPATGKTRRCVYYRKNDKSCYKFVVNNSKKQWFFQELATIENK